MTTISVITFRINPNVVMIIRSWTSSFISFNPNMCITKAYSLNRFTHHAMQVLTKVLELGRDLPIPLLVILLDEVPLPLVVELLNQPTIFDVLQHLKVCLTLYIFVVPHPVEETFGTVLDLHQGPRAIFILLNSVNPPNNLIQSPLDRTYIVGIEGIVLLQVGTVQVSSLILVPGPVVGVESLSDVILGVNELFGSQTRVLKLMVESPCLLSDIRT